MECVRIQEARYLNDYRIWIRFNTGAAGEVDLTEMINIFPIAEPLKEKSKFADFHLDSWPTLTWDCGFDVDPEYLYEIAARS